MEKIMIKNVCFGDYIPKVCVPIVGRNREEIIRQAQLIRTESDILSKKFSGDEAIRLSVIEFRADFYDEVTSCYSLKKMIKEIRDIFPDKLLLFTYRSEEEGGELRHDRAEGMITDIQENAINSGNIDMIDIELMSGNYNVARLAARAHEKGVATVISYHNFDETPHDGRLERYLWTMEQLGGDILKIAVKPKNEIDVERMIDLTERAAKGKLIQNNVTKPIAIISMDELGRQTRVMGRKTGSCLTFSYVGDGSAPGQIELLDMYKELGAKLIQ